MLDVDINTNQGLGCWVVVSTPRITGVGGGAGGGSKLGLSAFETEPVHLQSKNHRKKYEKNDLDFHKNG